MPIVFVKGRILYLKSLVVFLFLSVLGSTPLGILHVISGSQTSLVRGYILITLTLINTVSLILIATIIVRLLTPLVLFQFLLEVSCELMSKFFSWLQ